MRVSCVSCLSREGLVASLVAKVWMLTVLGCCRVAVGVLGASVVVRYAADDDAHVMG
jgi:hypothetical protein